MQPKKPPSVRVAVRPRVAPRPRAKLKATDLQPSSSSATTLRKIVKRPVTLSELKFPNWVSVVGAMKEADSLAADMPQVELGENLRLIRMFCIGNFLHLKVKFSLLDETVLLAVSLLDYYLGAHPELGRAAEKADLRTAFRDNDLLARMPDRSETRAVERVALSALFLATKFQEIHPPKLTDIAPRSILTRDEFVVLESAILKVVNFNVRPPNLISYIHLVNCRVLQSVYWATKIRQVAFAAVICGFLRHCDPLLFVASYTLVLIEKNLHEAKPLFKAFLTEMRLCHKKMIRAACRYSAKFREVIDVYKKFKVETVVQSSLSHDGDFTTSHLLKN